MFLYKYNFEHDWKQQLQQGFANKISGKIIVRDILKKERDFLEIRHISENKVANLKQDYMGLSLGGILGAGRVYLFIEHFLNGPKIRIQGGWDFPIISGRSLLLVEVRLLTS